MGAKYLSEALWCAQCDYTEVGGIAEHTPLEVVASDKQSRWFEIQLPSGHYPDCERKDHALNLGNAFLQHSHMTQ